MKITAATFAALAALAAGCAATPPANLPGTEGLPPDKLAIVSAESQEIKILDVDGKALPHSNSADFYLPPGAHRVRLMLHWCPGGQCTSLGSFAENPRTACFEAQAGARYKFTVSNVGPNWVPRVTETGAAGASRVVDAVCK